MKRTLSEKRLLVFQGEELKKLFSFLRNESGVWLLGPLDAEVS